MGKKVETNAAKDNYENLTLFFATILAMAVSAMVIFLLAYGGRVTSASALTGSPPPLTQLIAGFVGLSGLFTPLMKVLIKRIWREPDASPSDTPDRNAIRKEVEVRVPDRREPTIAQSWERRYYNEQGRKEEYKAALVKQREQAVLQAVRLADAEGQLRVARQTIRTLTFYCALLWTACATSLAQLVTSSVAALVQNLAYPKGIPGVPVPWYLDKLQFLLLIPGVILAAGIGYRYFRGRTQSKGGWVVPVGIGFFGVLLGGLMFYTQMTPELMGSVKLAGFVANFGTFSVGAHQFNLAFPLDQYLLIQRVLLLPLVGGLSCVLVWRVSTRPQNPAIA